jgi:hypothetical protein
MPEGRGLPFPGGIDIASSLFLDPYRSVMFEQAFKNIDDVLWKESGCTTELDYTEQTSWLLFLKYLDGLEQDKATKPRSKASPTAYILDAPYRWEQLGRAQGHAAASSTTTRPHRRRPRRLRRPQALPYLHGFKQRPPGPTPSSTRSARSSARSRTRSAAATPCATSSTTSTNCASAPRPRSTNSRTSTKPRSRTWATPGATAASTTPRAR